MWCICQFIFQLENCKPKGSIHADIIIPIFDVLWSRSTQSRADLVVENKTYSKEACEWSSKLKEQEFLECLYFSDVKVFFRDRVEIDFCVFDRSERFAHVTNEVRVDVVVQVSKRHFLRQDRADVIHIKLCKKQVANVRKFIYDYYKSWYGIQKIP